MRRLRFPQALPVTTPQGRAVKAASSSEARTLLMALCLEDAPTALSNSLDGWWPEVLAPTLPPHSFPLGFRLNAVLFIPPLLLLPALQAGNTAGQA